VYNHSFEGLIDRFAVGKIRKLWYTVLFLPSVFENVLPFARYPRLRVNGEIADVPVNGAWMPTGDGRRYFIVSSKVMKGAEVGVGCEVEMRFEIADQNAVDVPDELGIALATNSAANAAWRSLTPGKQRGMTHRIHGAKTASTRARRVAEVIAELIGAQSDFQSGGIT
jgi:hypothetical protein